MQERAALCHQTLGVEAATALSQPTEAALHTHITVFRGLVEDSLQGILVHRHHQPLFVNQAFAAMLGYTTPADILQLQSVLPLVAAEDRERLSTYCAARLHGEDVPAQYEYQALRRDGTRLWVEVRVTLVEWDGAPAMLLTTIDITDRKQAEAALRRERELLQKIIDTIPVMIAMYRPDTQVLQLNKEFERVTGWSTAAARQVDLMAKCYPDPAYRELVRAYMESLAPGWRDLQMTTKDGRVLETSWANLRLADDTHIGVGLDLTDRKQTAALREQLAAIVDASEDAIIGKTLEGIITSWNRGAERLYGYTAAEAIGQSITFLIPPDIPDELPQILERLQRGERIEQYETQRVRKDGTRLDVALTISPIRDGQGRIIGAAKIARDITARKQAEAVLRTSTARHRALFETTPDGIIILDDTGHYVEVNTSMCRLLRASRAQLVGTHLSQFLSPDHGPAVQEAFETLKTTGVYAGEFPMRAVDGTLVVMEWRARGHFLPGLHFCIARDITARKQAEEALVRLTRTLQQREEALRQANATLEQRVEERTAALRHEIAERQRLEQAARRAEHFALLGRLAAGVSHEIRNPLGAIVLHVDLLEEELRQPTPDSATQIPESLTEIKTHLARLDDLVQDYLSLVRVATIERTPQDLGTAMHAWVGEWQALAAAQGVTLRLDGLGRPRGSGISCQHAAACPPQPRAKRPGGHAAEGDAHHCGPGEADAGAAAGPGYGERHTCRQVGPDL
jgi:PAS domain S-box-containing protein